MSEWNDLAAVLAADDARLSATLAHDGERLRRIFAPDFSYTHSNGLREGAQNYIERIESGTVNYLSMRRCAARGLVEGSIAVIEGEAVMTYKLESQPAATLETLYLAVWRRIDSTWRISHYSSSPRL